MTVEKFVESVIQKVHVDLIEFFANLKFNESLTLNSIHKNFTHDSVLSDVIER